MPALPSTMIPRGISKKLTPTGVGMPPISDPFKAKKLTTPGVTNMSTPMKPPQIKKIAAYNVGIKIAQEEFNKQAFLGPVGGLARTLGQTAQATPEFLRSAFRTAGNRGLTGMGRAGAVAQEGGRGLADVYTSLPAAQKALLLGGAGAGAAGAGYLAGRPDDPTYQMGPFSYNGPSISSMLGR